MFPLDAVDSLEVRLSKYVLIGGLGLLVIASGLGAYSCHKGHVKTAAVAAADVLHNSAANAAAQGVRYDVQEKVQAIRTAADSRLLPGDATAVAQARAELARVRPAGPGPNPAPPAPGNPDGPLPVSAPLDLASVVSKQDDLIQALTRENGDLKAVVKDQGAEINTLILSRDSWKLSANSSAQEAVQLRAALAAQEGLIVAAEIKYGLGGFALGYGAGKVKR